MAAHYIVVKHIPLMQYISEYLGLAPTDFSPLFSFSLLPCSFLLITLCASSFYYIILRTKKFRAAGECASMLFFMSPLFLPLLLHLFLYSLYSIIIIPKKHKHTHTKIDIQRVNIIHAQAHTKMHGDMTGTITQANPNSCLVSHALVQINAVYD